MKTFLLAGHETSAAMLMWSVYELTKNESARQQVGFDATLIMLVGLSVRFPCEAFVTGCMW